MPGTDVIAMLTTGHLVSILVMLVWGILGECHVIMALSPNFAMFDLTHPILGVTSYYGLSGSYYDIFV